MKRSYKKIVCLVTVALVMVACIFDVSEEPVGVEKVLFVYMGGEDRSISHETYDKIDSITKGWNGDPKSRIMIYQDPQDDIPRLFEITRKNGKNQKRVVAEYEEENSASHVVFQRTLNEVIAMYPQASFGMLVFSHASGWLPQGKLNNPTKSIIMDGRSEMEIADFAAAIPDGLFDYIVFEACLMGSVEVAYELRKKCDYIFASSAEILSPGFLHIYPYHLGKLFDSNLEGFAKEAFAYFNNQNGVMQSATFSVIKTSELEGLSLWIRNNADLSKVVNIHDVQRFGRYDFARLFFDFEDYYSRLLIDPAKTAELTEEINKVVVWRAATPTFLMSQGGFIVSRHSGMSVYIEQLNYPNLNLEYRKLDWYKGIR